MIRWRVWLTFVYTLLLASFMGTSDAMAQNQNQQNQQKIELSQPLTLQQCIQLAIENSTDLRNARIDLAIQDLRVKNAKSRYYPDISLNGRYNFSDKIDFGFERENYDAGVTGQYTLWDNGQREANFSQAKESKNATTSRNEQTKQNLIFQVTQAYYNVLKTQELVNVGQEILARSRENTDRVKAFVQAGIQIEADVATAQVREANDELSLLNNQNDMEISRAVPCK